MWRHTWPKNWVNWAILTGNSAVLRTVFPVVFHIQNSGNPTVSSVYLPTPRWHHLKEHPFLAIHSADKHRLRYSFSNTTSYSTFYDFFSSFLDIIIADVASKQQTTALFLSTIVTRTRRHTELTKKIWQFWCATCVVPEHIQFSLSCGFFTQSNCTV